MADTEFSRKIAAYRATDYRFGEGRMLFPCASTKPLRLWRSDMPGSPHAIVMKGVGADQKAVWPQGKGYFVLDADLDAACTIGRRYRQDAVVWVGCDAVPKVILLH